VFSIPTKRKSSNKNPHRSSSRDLSNTPESFIEVAEPFSPVVPEEGFGRTLMVSSSQWKLFKTIFLWKQSFRFRTHDEAVHCRTPSTYSGSKTDSYSIDFSMISGLSEEIDSMKSVSFYPWQKREESSWLSRCPKNILTVTTIELYLLRSASDHVKPSTIRKRKCFWTRWTSKETDFIMLVY
jgi:hypothetical protein